RRFPPRSKDPGLPSAVSVNIEWCFFLGVSSLVRLGGSVIFFNELVYFFNYYGFGDFVVMFEIIKRRVKNPVTFYPFKIKEYLPRVKPIIDIALMLINNSLFRVVGGGING